jgi:hypothetical protein
LGYLESDWYAATRQSQYKDVGTVLIYRKPASE